MSVLWLLFAFGSGLLTLRYYFLGLVVIIIIIRFKRDCHKLSLLLVGYSVGLLLMIITTLLLKIPYTSRLGVVVRSNNNSFIFLTVWGRYYVSSKTHTYQVGDILRLSGSLRSYHFAMVEGDFDYGSYLRNSGVFSELLVSEAGNVFTLPRINIFKEIVLTPDYPRHLIPLRDVLLVRDIDYKDNLISTLLQEDLVILISLTGAHLSFIRRVFRKVLTIFFTENRSDRLSYLALIPLFLLNPTKFACYRIFGAGLFRYLNKKHLDGGLDNLKLNSLLALSFLLLNPYLIFNPGFYLSFSLIILFALVRPLKTLKGRLISVFLVWTVIIPYLMFSVGSLNILNLFLPFLLTPLVGIWFITYFMSLPFGFLRNVPLNLLNLIYQIIRSSVNYSLRLYFPTIPSFVVFLFLIGGFILLLGTNSRNRFLTRSFCAGFMSLLLLSFVPVNSFYHYAISFINVGQGDSILVSVRGEHALIDTGGLRSRDIATEVLIPYFKRTRVYRLKYLITTHDDFDHNGGSESLQQNFAVKEVITSGADFPLELGGVTFYNLNPGGYENDNDNSLIIYFSLPRFNVLLMGDAGVVNESELMLHYPTLSVDLLKVGHHGSNTSTSAAFIDHYRPTRAIISCGYQNSYGHPHASVLETLRDYNVRVSRTDLEGTIVVKSSII